LATTVPTFFLGATTTASIPILSTDDTSDKPERFLVTSSIDLNASDSLGRTCIHHLVQPFPDGSYTSNIELLQLLHSSGASLTKHDLAGLSPFQYGAINGCQHLCDELTKLTNDQTDSTPATIERFYINDPNKNLLDPPDFYSDAQQLIDKYLSTHPSSTHNAAYQVDRLSGLSVTGEVLIDNEKNEPYDVRLTITDVNYGVHGLYNFYRMQIIKHKSKNNLFFLFTRWGRIGDDEGQHQLTPYSTLDECRKEFLKVFREKTANNWKDTDQFETKPKKYTLIKLNDREMKKYSDVSIDFDRLQSEHTHPSSKLQSNIYENFLKTLINRQAIRVNINKTQLDVEWMPVSQLKPETLQRARDLLIELKKIIENKQKLTLEIQRSKSVEQKTELNAVLESIYKRTNEYYSIVPLRGYAEEKLPIIDNEIMLKQHEKILYDLMELELSYKILLGAQANLKTISPVDYLYKSMNCQFEAMNKDDIDSQFILRYIWASAENTQVEQIFKIARPNEDDRLFKSNLDNHYLLWHGTGICNLISILTRGISLKEV
jgi:predicted DNA-binding WGR domain protein